MQQFKKVLTPFLLTLAFASAPAFSNDCGAVPTTPELIKGAAATMEELVANSQSVKAYIAEADAYLDCNESFVKSEPFTALAPEEKQKVLDVNSKLLNDRNVIGEKFNEEVVAYKAANPQ